MKRFLGTDTFPGMPPRLSNEDIENIKRESKEWHDDFTAHTKLLELPEDCKEKDHGRGKTRRFAPRKKA